MYSSTLCPPNSHLLKDEVVTGGVLCARRANRASNHSAGFKPVQGNPLRGWVNSDGSFESRAPIPFGDMVNNNKRKGVETTDVTRFKRLKTASADEKYKAIAELLELGERVQRERRRQVQHRYRMKQTHLIDSLDKAIEQLRQEIKTLEQQRLRAPAATTATNDIWDFAMHYFRLVRLGFKPGHQLDSVREAMASDVTHNVEVGFEAIAQSWCFMQWFGGVEVELEHLCKSVGSSMIVTTKTSVTITEQTLLHVFPHLLGSKSEDENEKLVSKLLRQRIIMRGSTCFEWDTVTKRVVRVVAQSDMLTPMLRLLGNLDAVSRVFEKAHVSPSFQWRPLGRGK
ncbi:hypothetical protein F442_10585 [Phytophthora nicotianae P10297]|uniref:BZIP domain-containing protein n=2 Tax=Phytophthora nicotianae TaxID=4792 RepID=W2Z6A2_PHYNI|nr:hypothetical protein F444_10778 [Phytophthora nicotianae P1976]ETP42496.1 hypothetical protein F442_10585 [Phytophthora nicotianae P10297]